MSITTGDLDSLAAVVDARSYAVSLAGADAHQLDQIAFDAAVRTVTDGAESEILVLSGTARDLAAITLQSWEIRSVAQRRVACLEVVDGRLRSDGGMQTHLAGALVSGLSLRESPVPFGLRLVDAAVALLPSPAGEGGIMISSSDTARFLRTLFVAHWRRGHRVQAPRTGRLPIELIDVLQQIAAGTTDERAAAHLGLSLRTYRRRIEDLMHLLGVQSRFQAGAEAARRGLLDFLPAERPLG